MLTTVLAAARAVWRRVLAPIGFLTVLATAAGAQAGTIYFDFASDNGQTASFTIENGQSANSSQNGSFAEFEVTGGSFGDNGASVYFFNPNFGDGRTFQFSSQPGVLSIYAGADSLYSGSDSNPNFNLGSFNVAEMTPDCCGGVNYGGPAGVLKISDTAPDTGGGGAPGAPGPEIGLGLLPALAALTGLALTRRRRRCVR